MVPSRTPSPSAIEWSAFDGWRYTPPGCPTWRQTAGWNVPVGASQSWAILTDWRPPLQHVSWSPISHWRPSLDRLIAASSIALGDALVLWDERLADLDGDPAREDWTSFRPLRLSREEDWSDWLGHLLARSRSGRFPARLFGVGVADATRWTLSSYTREYIADDYRADLVLRFHDSEWIHVEVKVGDRQLTKTRSTGDAVRRHEVGVCRTDFLLLPNEDRQSWNAVRDEHTDGSDLIEVRTWGDVALALRASLTEAELESVSWRVWARAFLGAIEQRLLGYEAVPVSAAVGHRPRPNAIERLEYLKIVEAS